MLRLLEVIQVKTNAIKIYVLYELDQFGRPKYRGRFASRHRLKAAAMFMSNWFYEVDEKQDEYV
jgi:hypothetical protein